MAQPRRNERRKSSGGDETCTKLTTSIAAAQKDACSIRSEPTLSRSPAPDTAPKGVSGSAGVRCRQLEGSSLQDRVHMVRASPAILPPLAVK